MNFRLRAVGILDPGTLALTACIVTKNVVANFGGGIFNLDTVTCSGGGTVSGNTVGHPSVASDCIDVSVGSGCAACPT